MAPEIKICGITDVPALDAAIAARADYVGFQFYPPSPRYLTPAEATALATRAEGRIGRVGVFVDPSDTFLTEAVTAGSLDAIQLHGDESPARVAQIRQRLDLPIWKALPVAGPGDTAHADRYRGAADFILFDAKTPKGAMPGGMGLSFDWSLLAEYRGPLPWGLAGGLDPENVAEAIRITGASMVDTSSGVESAPGVKDVDKIAAFCQAARSL